MATTIHNIDQITCSLYVGDKAYIYSFDYSYVPTEGTKITIYFVNESGVYNVPQLVSSNAAAAILSVVQKVQITIGGALFSMYALSYELDEDVNRKILKVEFIDDTFRLKNYHVVLTGDGCGDRVFQLGEPVDPRTDAQKIQDSIDGTVQNIRNQAISTDIEYPFGEFLAIVQQAFPTIIRGAWDNNITKPFVGDFRSVLDAWCQYLNLIYYFEEGFLVINNPQSLNITFPAIPINATSVRQSESLENTFTATAAVTFKQDGGQFGDSGTVATELGTTETNGVIVTNLGLFPVGSQVNLAQTPVNLNQVAAAAYGQEYWFLYNYMQGTAQAECGWTTVALSQIPTSSLRTSIATLLGNASGGGIAYLNEDVYNQRFQFYQQYGAQIAGRYYLSDDQGGGIYGQENYKWFNQTNGQSFDLQQLLAGNAGDNLPISYFSQGIDGAYVEGTAINQYYPGVSADGNRLVYKDERSINLTGIFVLNDGQKALINTYAQSLIIGLEGSEALDYSQVGGLNTRYIVFPNQLINTTPGYVPSLTQVQNLTSTFLPANPVVNILGVKSSTLIQSNAPNGSNNIITTKGVKSVTNTNTLTTLADPIANIYFNKLNACYSQSSLAQAGTRGAFEHRLNLRQLSTDTPVLFSVNRTSDNSYTVLRNLSYLSLPAQGGATDAAANILTKTSLPQLQSLKKLSFTTNYFISAIPASSFISNGLTSLSVSISADGLDASYEFSNSMLYIPNTEIFFDNLARNMRNSWVRQYNPQQNATF